MIKKICLFVFGMSLMQVVLAENWVFLWEGEGKEVINVKMYYDIDSVNRVGNKVTVWMRQVEKEKRSNSAFGEKEIITFREYDCAVKQYDLIEAWFVFDDGKRSLFFSNKGNGESIRSNFDLINDFEFRNVCGLEKTTKIFKTLH